MFCISMDEFATPVFCTTGFIDAVWWLWKDAREKDACDGEDNEREGQKKAKRWRPEGDETCLLIKFTDTRVSRSEWNSYTLE